MKNLVKNFFFFSSLLFMTVGVAEASSQSRYFKKLTKLPPVKTFKDPLVGSTFYALDVCTSRGINCGQPTANAFCRSKGYEKATEFAMKKLYNDEDFFQTQTIHGGAICSHEACERISSVTCTRDSEESLKMFDRHIENQTEGTHKYINPKAGGYNLDRCRMFGSCGQATAQAFCVSMGHSFAEQYSVRRNQPTTITLTAGFKCTANFCDRIDVVTCQD